MNALNALINRDNATYKTINYILMNKILVYIWTVYTCVVMMRFEPALMYALMSSIVDYVPEAVGELKSRFLKVAHYH